MNPEPKDYTKPEVFMKAMSERDWEVKPTHRSGVAEILGGDYAYVDLGNGFNKAWSRTKQMTAFMNPFAIQQGSTYNRLGFSHFLGSRWFAPSPLPNDVSFGRMTPSHYDATKSPYFNPPDAVQGNPSFETLGEIRLNTETIPLSCVRPLYKLERCKMINGADKCQEESNAFLSICPNPVLAEMRNQKLMRAKHRQIQLADYRKAIEVSDYNKGRTVADVPLNVTKFTGSRHNLRPDTMWADERYINVTPEEIEAAKIKLGEHEKKIAARLNPKIHEVPHIDSNRQYKKNENMPVYAK